tara:strand:+ start:152 stop:391 length:240 start_codon:yes stop_codon:yes gene_type:complete
MESKKMTNKKSTSNKKLKNKKFNGKIYTQARSSKDAPDGIYSKTAAKRAVNFLKDYGANVRTLPTMGDKVRIYYRFKKK